MRPKIDQQKNTNAGNSEKRKHFCCTNVEIFIFFLCLPSLAPCLEDHCLLIQISQSLSLHDLILHIYTPTQKSEYSTKIQILGTYSRPNRRKIEAKNLKFGWNLRKSEVGREGGGWLVKRNENGSEINCVVDQESSSNGEDNSDNSSRHDLVYIIVNIHELPSHLCSRCVLHCPIHQILHRLVTRCFISPHMDQFWACFVWRNVETCHYFIAGYLYS